MNYKKEKWLAIGGSIVIFGILLLFGACNSKPCYDKGVTSINHELVYQAEGLLTKEAHILKTTVGLFACGHSLTRTIKSYVDVTDIKNVKASHRELAEKMLRDWQVMIKELEK